MDLAPSLVILPDPFFDVEELYSLTKNGLLGTGGYGTVRTCVDRKTGQKWACKTVFKEDLQDQDDVNGIRTEILAMKSLEGTDYIVQLREVIEDDVAVHIIMELCDGGDLFDLVATRGTLCESEASIIFRQIAMAVKATHEKNWIHRDIKPENIFLCKKKSPATTLISSMLFPQRNNLAKKKDIGCNFEVKLGDFGLVMSHRKGQIEEGIAGSPCYMAPEIINGECYTEQVDLWSLGIVLYAMLAGEQPFNGSKTSEIFQAAKSAKIDVESEVWQSISEEAKDLVKGLIRANPDERLTIKDVLSHPWLAEIAEDEK